MAWAHNCSYCQHSWDAKTREGLCPNCGSILIIATNLDAIEKFDEKKIGEMGTADKKSGDT